MLDHLRVRQSAQTLEADVATLFLRKDSTVERVMARGNVKADSQGDSETHLRAEQLEVLMAEQRDTVRTATFSGNVQMEAAGDQPMEGNAGRVILIFGQESAHQCPCGDDRRQRLRPSFASRGTHRPKRSG